MAIKRNLDEAHTLLRHADKSMAVMVKDFYSHLGVEYTASEYLSNRVYRSVPVGEYGMPDSNIFNHIIGQTQEKHGGGFVAGVEDLQAIADMYPKTGRPFEAVVPVDMLDNREGLSVEQAIELQLYSQVFSNVIVRTAALTAGCTASDIPAWGTMGYMCERLVHGGFDFISVGGSHFLSWAYELLLPPQVTEVRVGEFILLGTIPFDPNGHIMGESAIEISIPVIQVHRDRQTAVCYGGYTLWDAAACCQGTGYECVRNSAAYTVLRYPNTAVRPSVGDMLTFTPNYESLPRILSHVD